VKREREDFLALSTTTSGEAFALEAGIDLLEYGSAGLPQALRVRASRPGNVMYLMDGVPVSNDRLGAFDLNWLPLAGMAGAEVAMNGQSGLYGSGATGGVMNLTSMSAMPEVPTSEVVAWWGSFDSRAVHFRFNRRITSTFGILLSFENLHSTGWTESSEANSNKFYGKLTGFLGRGVTYDVVGYRYDAGTELPDSCPNLSGTYPADVDDKGDFISVSVAAGSEGSVRLDYYHVGAERDYRSGGVVHSGKGSLDGFSVVSNSVTEDSSMALAGIGYRRFKIDDRWGSDGATNDIYGYAAGEKRFQAWRLRGSFRVERTWGSGRELASSTELAGDLGASVKVHQWLTLNGRVDRSFSYSSLRWCSDWTQSCCRDTAEHWNSLELGADLGAKPIRFSAAFYWRRVDNSTLRMKDEACEWVRPAGEEISYLGAEALLRFTGPSWFRGSLGYSAERARDGAGEKVSYVPSGIFTWDLRAQRTFSKHVSAGLAFAGRWVSPVDVGGQLVPCSEADCISDAELDGYISGLLYGYIEIDRGRVYARIRNLFNQGITQLWGFPELPPRSYELGVNLELLD
jgi:outer membrane receptor protein involved in Fe transport